jgi:hypothetical protein
MQLDPDKVPNTMDEAVAMVIAGLSEEDKVVLRDPAVTVGMMHFGVGQFIRNAWSFWEDTPLRRDCIQRWRIAHGDDVSGLLLAWVVAELRGESFDPADCCSHFHAHWTRHGTTSLAAVNVADDRAAAGENKFAIFCDTLCQGSVPVGLLHEEGQPTRWLTFDTEREAQLDIVDDIEEHIRQFREGEREFEDLSVDLYIVPVTVYPDGSISTESETFPPPENDNQDPT